MYELASELFPINRSITGDGVRQTLRIIQREVPELVIREIPSGTKCFDWDIPNEWNIRDAYIKDANGKKIVDFAESNLSVVGYSLPINAVMTLEELDKHIYSLVDQPTVIPYVTSYYKKNWGFCLPHEVRKSMKPGSYQVYIDSTLEPGSLTYGEILLPGESKEEILFSTYCCHPSMANNEVSGPVLTAFLANFIKSTNRRYSYRFVFAPETISRLGKSRAAINLGYSNKKNLSCLSDKLVALLDYDKRIKLNAIARSTVDGMGTERTADIIIQCNIMSNKD